MAHRPHPPYCAGPEKGKVLGHYEEGKAPVKFTSKVEEYYRQIILSSD